MKRRRRASEAERSANASSICPSIALSEPPRRPTSVVPPSGSTRRERSPAPIAAAVSSIRRSGRRLAVISQSPASSAVAITAQATSSSIQRSWSSVSSVSTSGAPRISVSSEGSVRASRRKRAPPSVAPVVMRRARPVARGCEVLRHVRPRRLLAGAREHALERRVLDRDVHARRQHAEPREQVDLHQRPLLAAGAAALDERLRDALRARVERPVDALEQRRAQRGVGDDARDPEAGRQQRADDDEQAGAQRHAAHAAPGAAAPAHRPSGPARAARSRPA